MGGIGSGHRWRHDAKSTTDDYRQLDARQLARAGALESGFTGRWRWMLGEEHIASIDLQAERNRIWLSYRHRHADGDWKSERYPVYLAWTACRLGGQRPWFLCPANGCYRRIAILYGGTIFACRHCHRLAYASSRETVSERTLRYAGKVRAKLGWQPGILNPGSSKPKGMRWRTFERLIVQHDIAVEQAMVNLAVHLRIDR